MAFTAGDDLVQEFAFVLHRGGPDIAQEVPMSKGCHKRKNEMLRILHPDAAGINIGAEEVFVAVSSDRDSEPVRRFSTFTGDLLELAAWLKRAISTLWRWNRPACIGFRSTRFWKLTASRYFR